MPGLWTYWHTLRHLRPIQIYGRARLRLARRRVDLRPAPRLRQTCRDGWVHPARRGASLLGPSTVRFLNRTEDIASIGWDNAAIEKLWRYNLHYFDDLNAVDADSRGDWHRTLMQRWVEENKPGIGTGWEPYPTSLRIVNWIKWALQGNEVPPRCLDSLAAQARWLSGKLEIHLLGNHLLANAKALVFAGAFFDGPEADAWLNTGLRVLEREIPEQILADGGHFERSTMYHVLALEDLLDLCNVAATSTETESRLVGQSSAWRARIAPMRHWLAAMSHPDGEISFFNDAAMGMAPSPRDIDEYAIRLGFGSRPAVVAGLTDLSASGYLRLESDQTVLIVDAAPVGPDYLPAHAHADTLSFELSVFGQRVFVNSGASLYGSGDERLAQRGTAAQNTVIIDRENSSEVWGGFRVARRARPVGLLTASGESIMVRCSHDGYARLRGSPQHTRSWELTQTSLVIEDGVSGEFRSAEARFHLHPAIRIDEPFSAGKGRVTAVLTLPRGQKILVTFDGGVLKREATTWHPEFGRKEPNTCLVNEFRSEALRARITWSSTQ